MYICIILDLLEDRNLKLRLAEKSTWDAVNVVKNAFQTNSCAVVQNVLAKILIITILFYFSSFYCGLMITFLFFFVVEIDASFDSKAFWFFKEENRFLQKFQTAFFTYYENVIPVFISNKSYILPRIRGTHGCFLVSLIPSGQGVGPLGMLDFIINHNFKILHIPYGLSIPK